MKEMLYVYNIKNVGEKTYWNKIGVAFVNKDDSLNVVLDCFPISGKMTIMKPKNKNEKEEQCQDSNSF